MASSRYYVAHSSWFDTHPYDRAKIKRAIELGGGTNVRESYGYGWSNQPKVLTFDASVSTKMRVKRELEKALRTSWIIVRKKDW